MIVTDGRWDPTERPAYFLAGNGDPMLSGDPHTFVLIAVNEMVTRGGDLKPQAREAIDRLLARGTRILIDSGVFWLTNEHKRAHDITMDEALGLPPTEIDGFDWLWESYLTVHAEFREVAWGFIELDQGGADAKRATRARLHELGVKPMPVYHPLNDGFDYFDELAASHDRLCFGNIVQASTGARLRLLHTLSERHRAYPELWVHVLGYTPNAWVNALSIDSCDSSTWLGAVRWGPPSEFAMAKRTKNLGRGFCNPMGGDRHADGGYAQATYMSAVIANMMQRSWRHFDGRKSELLGLDRYPAVTP